MYLYKCTVLKSTGSAYAITNNLSSDRAADSKTIKSWTSPWFWKLYTETNANMSDSPVTGMHFLHNLQYEGDVNKCTP